jgi:hypothetical protein
MSTPALSQRLRDLSGTWAAVLEMTRHMTLPGEVDTFTDRLAEAIAQAEAMEAQAPINWKDIKVTKGQETHPLGRLIELLEHERDTAIAALKMETPDIQRLIKDCSMVVPKEVAPTVDPWISVKDRLPEEEKYERSEMVLCQTRKEGIAVLFYSYRYKKWRAWNGDEWPEATHWMPLPPKPLFP